MPSVLVVDDNAENRYFLEALLTGNGFVVRSADNGAQALASALTDPPDLIVSDILMPVMDGFALCREWRKNDRLRGRPFIFYTATYTDKQDEDLALSLGAAKFVVKPQEPAALLGIIREVLAGPAPVAAGASPGAGPGEDEFLRGYNEVLFHKLEKKVAELERSNRELQLSVEEQRRLEDRLRQALKLEAVGRFSAGIAHDFNNILTVIVGFGDLLREKVKTDESELSLLDQILAAAGRAQNLTRSLLSFSRLQAITPRPLSLNHCVRNLETFLDRVVGKDVKLTLSFREKDIPIVADAGQIEQILMNLASNARDAMPGGGLLAIGTDVLMVDAEFVRLNGYGAPGRYAVLSVTDTGCGMGETTRKRIFEPFFTTKEAGKGTGLGLAIVYGIVQQHQGHISVSSEPGQGTSFRILLPLMPGDVAAPGAPVQPRPLRGGTETILVVENEPAIRRYLELYLESLGYRVLRAKDGLEAVEVFREKGRGVDLVLMDVVLPRKSGKEAAAAIRQIRGDAKIVFTSGYPFEAVHERRLLDDGERLLLKPLTPTDLAGSVRGVLDGEPAAESGWAAPSPAAR